MARRVEANAPAPLVLVDRHASAHGDAADTDVVIMDQPSLLAGVRIAAAGEGVGMTMIPPIGRGKPLGWQSKKRGQG
jgi:hypothetical protein